MRTLLQRQGPPRHDGAWLCSDDTHGHWNLDSTEFLHITKYFFDFFFMISKREKQFLALWAYQNRWQARLGSRTSTLAPQGGCRTCFKNFLQPTVWVPNLVHVTQVFSVLVCMQQRLPDVFYERHRVRQSCPCL